jgi:NADPH:quinone reductase-like Zn-dependent oxidoreductase
MQAIVQTSYGGSETLTLQHIKTPNIGADEVLLRVHAAGVDRAVWHLMTGTPYLVRPAFGLCKPRMPVPGIDLSGQVVAIGRRVTHLRLGDEVFGLGTGAYAEYARARADQLVQRPRQLDATAAAVCAMSGVTALQALHQVGQVQAGQQVLIIGASGGVGSYAVQIAKCFGAEVSALCSAAKADFVKTQGADHVFDYAGFDIHGHTPRYDLIIDIAGNRPLAALRRLLSARGTLVIVGGEQAGPWTGGLGRQLAAWLLNPFLPQRLHSLISIVHQDDLRQLAELLVSGCVRPTLECVFPLSEAARAIDHLASGRVRGKTAIAIVPRDH